MTKSAPDSLTAGERKLVEFAVEKLPQYAWAQPYLPFHDCGFDNRLISALIAFGITHPDQLMQLSPRELTWIPDVGPKGRAAIEPYRERMRETSVPPP
jgi:hypothetical protein